MMKKHGKIAAILSVCILALAGCGNGETAADTVTAELTETTEEQTSAETTEAEETEPSGRNRYRSGDFRGNHRCGGDCRGG